MKNQHPGRERIDDAEIQRLRRILEIQREETLRALNRLGQETRSVESDCPKDLGDLCATSMSKESLFRQTSEQRRMIRVIEAALARIELDTFGVCEACGEDINPRRLDALPWTNHCLRCQQNLEQNQFLADRGSTYREMPLRKAG